MQLEIVLICLLIIVVICLMAPLFLLDFSIAAFLIAGLFYYYLRFKEIYSYIINKYGKDPYSLGPPKITLYVITGFLVLVMLVVVIRNIIIAKRPVSVKCRIWIKPSCVTGKIISEFKNAALLYFIKFELIFGLIIIPIMYIAKADNEFKIKVATILMIFFSVLTMVESRKKKLLNICRLNELFMYTNKFDVVNDDIGQRIYKKALDLEKRKEFEDMIDAIKVAGAVVAGNVAGNYIGKKIVDETSKTQSIGEAGLAEMNKYVSDNIARGNENDMDKVIPEDGSNENKDDIISDIK